MRGSIRSVILSSALLLAACATQPKPVIRTVCVEFVGFPAHEVEFLLKHTRADLAEYGMVQSSSADCDVRTKYQPFGNFQGEVMGGLSAAGYWSQEGTVTVTRNGRVIAEDVQTNLRGYASRQNLLEELAWRVLFPVTGAFKGALHPH